jgi:hypothetical protein
MRHDLDWVRSEMGFLCIHVPRATTTACGCRRCLLFFEIWLVGDSAIGAGLGTSSSHRPGTVGSLKRRSADFTPPRTRCVTWFSVPP